MIKTTLIDFIARRLPDGAATYPDWTIRCTWACADCGGQARQTFHDGVDERTARVLARFILGRYRNLDMRTLGTVDIRMPDGTWDSVPIPTGPVTAPVRFAFQRQPVLPDRQRPEASVSYL